MNNYINTITKNDRMPQATHNIYNKHRWSREKALTYLFRDNGFYIRHYKKN